MPSDSAPRLGGDVGRAPLRAREVLWVFTGGTVGTAARAGVGLLLPAGGFPVATVVVNLVGAYLLGLLLESLALRGPDRGRRRSLRLLLGTGALGGFTTYSALATDTLSLAGTGAPGLALVYALSSVLVGAAATAAGIASAALARRSR